MSAAEAAFSVARDPLPTYVLLGITAAALLLSILASYFDIAAGREQHRIVNEGVATTTYIRSRHSDAKPTSESTQDYDEKSIASSSAAATSSAKASTAKRQASYRRRRTIVCVLLARLLYFATIIGAAALGVFLLMHTYRNGALATIADDRTSDWTHALMQRSLLDYAEATNNSKLADESVVIGVGPELFTTGKVNGAALWRWAVVVLVLLLYSMLGVTLGFAKDVLPPTKLVAIIMIVQVILWICVSLVATFTYPTKLPLDGSPLRNNWLDRKYTGASKLITEERAIGNFYYSTKGSGRRKDAKSLMDLPDFSKSFCRQYVKIARTSHSAPKGEVQAATTVPPLTNEDGDAVGSTTTTATSPTAGTTTTTTTTREPVSAASLPPPTTPTTTAATGSEEEADSPDDDGDDNDDLPERIEPPAARPTVRRTGNTRQADSVTIPELPRELYDVFFLVYVVGKPIGTDHFRAIAYMALPALTGAPILLAYMFRTYVLYPFAALWLGVLGVLSVLATPAVLRVLTAPRDIKETISFCKSADGRPLLYRILVYDRTTGLIAVLDMVIFTLTALVVLLQALRWLRDADWRKVDERPGKEARTLNYEDVYSGSGTLRW